MGKAEAKPKLKSQEELVSTMALVQLPEFKAFPPGEYLGPIRKGFGEWRKGEHYQGPFEMGLPNNTIPLRLCLCLGRPLLF